MVRTGVVAVGQGTWVPILALEGEWVIVARVRSWKDGYLGSTRLWEGGSRGVWCFKLGGGGVEANSTALLLGMMW